MKINFYNSDDDIEMKISEAYGMVDQKSHGTSQ